MGRVFDGGYADYTCVPAAQVIPFRSDLDWATLGAVPEMLQTSYGSLTTGLDARPGQSIPISHRSWTRTRSPRTCSGVLSSSATPASLVRTRPNPPRSQALGKGTVIMDLRSLAL
jgi:hypothetical protein